MNNHHTVSTKKLPTPTTTLPTKIIQEFHRAATVGGGITGTLKEGGEIKSVVTQADFDAQARIIGGLRQTWGDDLRMIGEEDEDDAPPTTTLVGDGLLDRTLLLDSFSEKLLDEEIPINELALFIDPLDGTREFVEGRLENVACLIGITRNSRPIAGVIGLPFPEGSQNKPVRVYYAIGDQLGNAGSWPVQIDDEVDMPSVSTDTITILTGDSRDPVLINATNHAKSLAGNPNHLLIGGTAAKLRIVATQPNSLAILHFKTQLWDTCAPQALIESNGGKVTDLFGSPLDHSPDRLVGNILGVVASSGEPEVTRIHDELCATTQADPMSVQRFFNK